MSRPQGKHERPLAAKYVNLLLNVACSIFKSAIGGGARRREPGRDVRRPKVERRRWRILEPDEVPARLRGVLRRSGAQGVPDARADRATPLRAAGAPLEARQPRRGDAPRRRVEVGGGGEADRAPADARRRADGAVHVDAVPADDDYVFCHPQRGTTLERRVVRQASSVRRSPRPGSRARIRAFHDMRHTASDEPRRDRREPDRGDGDGRAPVDADDEGLPAPGRRRVPRRRRRARAADARGTKFRYKVAGNGCRLSASG